MIDHGVDSSDVRWLGSTWPFVQAQLPVPPATIVEIGCGPLGGFVPALRSAGYDALGIDPLAPDGPNYAQTEFECSDLDGSVDAVVACTSLHHVSDLDDVVCRIASALDSGGVLVVVEWARERFDERTARWCFDRLAATRNGEESGWLHGHREGWAEPHESWMSYIETWARSEHMHTGQEIMRALQARFDTESLSYGPYFFADLDRISPAQEQQAIDDGQIRATGIRYVGRPKASAP